MTALEYILDGLAAELALERELGVRVVECDRSLLAPPSKAPEVGHLAAPIAPLTAQPAVAPVERAKPASPSSAIADIVFLHDKPLSPPCEEMMAKIVAALGKTHETAPVVTEGAVPRAKAYVVLGGLALKKWFPGVSAAPGQWVATPLSPNVLVTYSPAYIQRFGTVTPAVQQIKKDMWTSIKSVLRRIQG